MTGRFQIVLGRRLDLVRRVPDQSRQREQEDDARRADRSPQETRRIAFELELPPQVLRVLDVLECEEPEPHRCHERRRNCRDPGGREPGREECGFPIKGRSRHQEYHDQRDQ